MSNYWLAVGLTDNWRTAFDHGNIWGLKEKQRHLWERLDENDILLFYATQPVGGIIGYGIVRTKFKQHQPLWPQEIRENKVIWPLRFEFDVQSCLPPDRWTTQKIVSDVLRPRSGFQQLNQYFAQQLISLQGSMEYVLVDVTSGSIAEGEGSFAVSEESPTETPSPHEEIKKTLVEIGRLQKFIAEQEYSFDLGRLDVVWRRIQKSDPTYVFEVQVGGDVYHALAKLKHAFDLWNSHIFIVASLSERDKVNRLLSGTFHEIGDRIRFIELDKIKELYKRKKAYLDLEKELGI